MADHNPWHIYSGDCRRIADRQRASRYQNMERPEVLMRVKGFALFVLLFYGLLIFTMLRALSKAAFN